MPYMDMVWWKIIFEQVEFTIFQNSLEIILFYFLVIFLLMKCQRLNQWLSGRSFADHIGGTGSILGRYTRANAGLRQITAVVVGLVVGSRSRQNIKVVVVCFMHLKNRD